MVHRNETETSKSSRVHSVLFQTRFVPKDYDGDIKFMFFLSNQQFIEYILIIYYHLNINKALTIR